MKKTINSASHDTILKLKVSAKKKEGVRRKLVVTAKEKESVRSSLAVTAKKLAATARERESIRRKLAVTALALKLKAKQLATTAKEKESIRSKLVVTAKKLAATAREKENVRSKLAVTAEKLAATAKEKEGIRSKLAVTAGALKLKAKNLATTAREKESVRRKLVVTAKEKESVRHRLVVTAKKLAATAKEKESVRHRLVVTAKKLAATAKEKESIRSKLAVTAKKLAATAKEREQASLYARSLIEASLDPLVTISHSGKITDVNEGSIKVTGVSREKLIGTDFSDYFTEPMKAREGYQRVFKEGFVTDYPLTIRHANGQKLTDVHYNASVYKDDKGNVLGVFAAARDITKEKELDRVKSEFISIASHQLRTPLTSIQWVVERFTKKENLTPKGKEYLDDIHMSVKRLNELVNLLLSLSRIEAGKVGITPEPLEVIAFVKSFLNETAPLRDKKELKIVFEDHPAKLSVKTDNSALRNIVQSLISNAIEYTPAGGNIDIAVQKENETFMIKIRDTGIGIPRAQQSHIFEKFVRASNAKLYKTDGTGIGLYIAERSASRLGGKIWFESEENKGSTFYVELPLEFKPKKEQKPL